MATLEVYCSGCTAPLSSSVSAGQLLLNYIKYLVLRGSAGSKAVRSGAPTSRTGVGWARAIAAPLFRLGYSPVIQRLERRVRQSGLRETACCPRRAAEVGSAPPVCEPAIFMGALLGEETRRYAQGDGRSATGE